MLAPIWYLVVGGVVLCLPGIAWWAWFPEKEKDILEIIAEISGLSVAISALVVLWMFLLGWEFKSLVVGLIYALLGALAAAGVVRMLLRSRRTDSAAGVNHANGQRAVESPTDEYRPDELEDSELSVDEQPAAALETQQMEETAGVGRAQTVRLPNERAGGGTRSGWILRNVVLLLGFVMILAWRFYQVRDLVIPAWVDPLHHTLIVRLFLENGGLPGSFRPYMEVPFSYHFAFHAVTAAFAFLARCPVEQAVLVVGQVLNALVAVSVYRLGLALWADWRRAGAAALLVGFVFQMPAYYATWGRYTLLTGLVLLPLAMAVSLDIANKGRSNPRLIKMALLTGGVLLSHYFTALLLVLFLLILGLQILAGNLKLGRNWRESHWLRLTAAALAGAVLVSPWIARTLGINQDWVGVTMVSPAQTLDSVFFPNYLSYLWRMLGPRRNHVLMALALLGLVIAIWRPKTRSFGFWALAMGLFSLPWGFHLAPFRPDHFVIVLFLPAALLISDFVFSAWERLQAGRYRKVGDVLVSVVLLSLLVWGQRETRYILNQTTVFTSQADLEAVEWVAGNTPPEARFLTNVTHWQYRTYRGVDGGWWIMPLTGRETLLPPALYIMGEREYVDGINSFAATASQLQECSAEFWGLVQEAGVTHVYLVEGRGSLKAEELAGCEGLSLVYDRKGVTIFEVDG
jgi:hypothetical protein